MQNLKSLVHAVRSVPGATNIPEYEEQSFNPPHIPISKNPRIEPIGKIDVINSVTNDNWIPNPDFLDDTFPRPFTDNEDALNDAIARCLNKRPLYGEIGEHGTEALAWYVSFHSSRYWGIYIPYSGLFRFADKFRSSTRAIEAIQLAWSGLLAHESVHFAVDVACAKMEVLMHSPIYLLRVKRPFGYSTFEEQLANGNLLSAVKKASQEIDGGSLRSSQYQAAVRMVRGSPPGYKDGEKSVTVKNFTDSADQHLNMTLAVAVPHLGGPAFPGINASVLFPCVLERSRLIPNKIDVSQCPIYVFDDLNYKLGGGNVIRFITSLIDITETDDFMKKVIPLHLEAWNKTKELLANPCVNKCSRNLDFKRWESGDDQLKRTRAWSVRVGGARSNFRAHLNEVIGSGEWIANKFGDGDKMGHHKQRR